MEGYMDVGGELSGLREFNREQLLQIELGRKKGLDINEYARVEYPWELMRQIRLAMEDGMDMISLGAKGGFNWQQLREVRRGFIHNTHMAKINEPFINVISYFCIDIPADKMKIIRKGMINGVDLIDILDAYNDSGAINSLSNEDLTRIIKTNIELNQLKKGES